MSKHTRKRVVVAVVAVAVVASIGNAIRVNLWETRRLYPSAIDAPAVPQAAPAAEWSGAADRARQSVRAAFKQQNLPAVSVAVGVKDQIVWAEAFGWADIKERVPATADTPFRIGSASQLFTDAAARKLTVKSIPPLQPVADSDDESPLTLHRCEHPADAVQYAANDPTLGWIKVSAEIESAAHQPFLAAMHDQVFQPSAMSATGAESAKKENPEDIGGPGEDAPPFQAVHDLILVPLGLQDKRMPGPIATVYKPADGADPRNGVRAIQLRNLSCYAGALSFYSTASDVARFASTTHVASYDGQFFGGRILSVRTGGNGQIVVAVISNASHADTAAIAEGISTAFLH